jgi:hypothetical protein
MKDTAVQDSVDEEKRLIEGSPSHPVEIDRFLFAAGATECGHSAPWSPAAAPCYGNMTIPSPELGPGVSSAKGCDVISPPRHPASYAPGRCSRWRHHLQPEPPCLARTHFRSRLTLGPATGLRPGTPDHRPRRTHVVRRCCHQPQFEAPRHLRPGSSRRPTGDHGGRKFNLEHHGHSVAHLKPSQGR